MMTISYHYARMNIGYFITSSEESLRYPIITSLTFIKYALGNTLN